MEFISNYGLFFAKTLTLLVALGIALAIIAAASKNRPESEGQISVTKLNDRFEDYKELMQESVLSELALKELEKTRKKQDKADKKQRKSQKSGSIAEEESAKKVYVTEFDGDVKASDVENLRKVITAILTIARKQDEVVIKLESPGGMVHSYGLASSQLARVTAKGIPLTVCVDKVAASGGYMMACVAQKIVAAPFAILGSIGVVAQLPNFHRLLKKSNVDYEMLTAGEYKRTLTMFGENTDKGREKFIEDLEDTHTLFKDFVSEHRPSVNITEVATGEIWFGSRALDNKLIDEIKTSDEYLFELSENAEVFSVKLSPKKTFAEKLGLAVSSGVDAAVSRGLQYLNYKFYS